MLQKGKNKQYLEYLVDKKRDTEINELLQATRKELKELYKIKVSDKEKRENKKLVFLKMQKKYHQLKKSWNGYSAYDLWMKQDLNNAHLLLIATYHGLVPTFQSMLKKENNNLKRFYGAVKRFSELNKEERMLQLKQLARK